MKQFLFLAFIFTNLSLGMAQNKSLLLLDLGINYSSIFQSNIIRYDPYPIIGVNVGAVYERNIFSTVSATTGLYYTEKGFKTKSLKASIIEVETESKFSYVEIPYQLIYSIPFNSFSSIGISAGLYTSLLLNGKISHQSSNSLNPVGNDIPINNFDFGYTLGIRYQYSRFYTGFKISNGITDISSNTKNAVASFYIKFALRALN